jgi:hypothetical protein
LTVDTTDPSSPYYIGSAVNALGNFGSGAVDFAQNNAANIAAALGGATALESLTTPDTGKVEASIKANKGGLDWKNSSTMKEARANKIAAFKKIASVSGSPVPTDDAIAKMKPEDIKKYVIEKRKGILGRAYGKLKGKKMPGKLTSALAKGGVITAVVLGIKDLATALTPQEVAELEATDELINAQNAPSQSGTAGGETWERK